MTSDQMRRQRPEVSIIVPVHNDAEWVGQALESCQAQTLSAIEVIVVDDASTDDTVSVVESYQSMDDRIRLIRQETNGSAFRARRTGIEAATAPYVLFLDGDDELVPETAETSLSIARAQDADIVAFGCKVLRPNGEPGGRYEEAMQPVHPQLEGADILDKLFPIGQTAQGQLWRYLFDRELLVRAYAPLPESLILRRVNDLPIMFLALMHARKYVSTSAALYRYFFRRGASGHLVKTIDDYLFTASAIDSIEAISGVVAAEADTRTEGAALRETYESARLSVIGRVLDYVNDTVDEELRQEALAHLVTRVGLPALVLSSADFCSKALPILTALVTPAPLTDAPAQHVVLRTGNLRTGGVQGVLVAQAGFLVRAGHRVTVILDAGSESAYALPDGVELVHIEGRSQSQKAAWLVEYCTDHDVTLVIDHHILYNERWPVFALSMALAGIAMVGWLHNFALRPIMDGNDRLSFLERNLRLLTKVVVLSAADVAYWKLRGIDDVVYLPNPASPMLERLTIADVPREAPGDAIDIVWWGRLQQSTKQVKELVHIGRILADEGIDFRLSLIGPDGPDLTGEDIRRLAIETGIEDRIDLLGERRGAELIDAIAGANVFVSTSAIEGYPLALIEAQAFGLPIVMYDLPWLAFLDQNEGIAAVRHGDRRAAARAIASLADPGSYAAYSLGSLAAARTALAHDFVALYDDFIRGDLGSEYSPEPTPHDMSLLLDQHVVFVERLIRRERRANDRARNDAREQRSRANRLYADLQRVQSDGSDQRKRATQLTNDLQDAQTDAATQRRKANRLEAEVYASLADAEAQREEALRLAGELAAARADAEAQREEGLRLTGELEAAFAHAAGQRKKSRQLAAELQASLIDAEGQRKKARRLSGELREARIEAEGQRKKARRLAGELKALRESGIGGTLKKWARRVKSVSD